MGAYPELWPQLGHWRCLDCVIFVPTAELTQEWPDDDEDDQ
jgi:hypothetical protein